MRCVQRFVLITFTAVFFCFPGHTVLTMAEEKVPDSEQAYLLTAETASKHRWSFSQLSTPELLAQAEPGTAGSDTDTGTSAADEEAKIAEALANPLSYLWLMFVQNDTYWYNGDILDRLGEDTKVMNTTLIQPVLSFQLTEKWKTIFRMSRQITWESLQSALTLNGRQGWVTSSCGRLFRNNTHPRLSGVSGRQS